MGTASGSEGTIRTVQCLERSDMKSLINVKFYTSMYFGFPHLSENIIKKQVLDLDLSGVLFEKGVKSKV